MTFAALTNVYGTPTYNNNGKFGKSLIIDGINGCATTAFNGDNVFRNAPGTFTIEGWAKITGVPASGDIRVMFGVLGFCLFYVNPDGTVNAETGRDAGQVKITSPTALNGTGWHHYAMVRDTLGGRFYIDGIQVGTTTNASFDSGTSGVQFALGVFTAFDGDKLKFIGELDDVAVWTTARYTANFTPPTTPIDSMATGLSVLYPMNDSLDQTQGMPSPSAPGFISAPVISGTPTSSVPTSYTSGDYSGYPTPTISQQWSIDGVDIAGATGATYTPSSGDVGKSLRVKQTITNSEGTASSTSAPVTVLAADTTKPTFSSGLTSIDGSTVTITMSELLAGTPPALSAFTLTGKTFAGIAFNGSKIILSGVSPAYVYGDTPQVAYVKPASNPLRDASGNEADSFGPAGIVNSLPAPPPPGTTIKTVGAGKDYPSLSAAQGYINNTNWPAIQQRLDLVVYENQNVNGVSLMPQNSSADYYVNVIAAGSYATSGAFNYDAADGITLIGGLDNFVVGQGSRISGFNVELRDEAGAIGKNYFGALSTSSQNYGTGGTYSPRIANCRILAKNRNVNLNLGGYGVWTYFDNCLIIQETTYNNLFSTGGHTLFNGCTVVRRNGAGSGYIWTPESISVENTGFINCGDKLNNGSSEYRFCRNNMSDTAVVGAVKDSTPEAPIGITVAANLVVNAASDYTPAAGSALLGAGNYRVKSTSDIRGNNRGSTPDIGVVQRTPAPPLTIATLVGSVVPDGQSLVLTWMTQNNPTSGYVTLTPVDTVSGGVKSGPYPITLGNGTASVTIDNIQPGPYMTPTATFINTGGPTLATGGNPFEIIGVDSVAEDVVSNVGPATALVWTVATSGVAGTPITITVGLNGTSNATVRATFDDNGADGSFSAPYVDIVNGVAAQATYTKPTAGTANLSLTNNANFTNPASVTFTAAPPPAQAPAITIATAIGNIMAGKVATLSGSVDLKGDANGHVDVFADPQPSGTPIALGAANVANGTWTKQNDLAPGLYQLRIVAKANGLTATAKTGNVRVLKLVGNFNLPAA